MRWLALGACLGVAAGCRALGSSKSLGATEPVAGGSARRDLAISADGTRVALIGGDGIARIVDVATRTVVGVLAPPRSSIDRAAFSPSGDTILTIDRSQLLVTLWRADTFAPIWTSTLPGQT